MVDIGVGREGGIDADEGFFPRWGRAYGWRRGVQGIFLTLFLFFRDLMGRPRSCAEVPRPGWLAT